MYACTSSSMSSSEAARAPVVGAAAEDSRYGMKEATLEWDYRENGFVEGRLMKLDWLKRISLETKEELFFPDSIYVRKEMCDVFGELTKQNRKSRQILIGSPGVGKSILLFLVALYRVLDEGTPTIYFRKTKDPEEFVSVFYIKKVDDSHVRVFYDREVDNGDKTTARDTVEFILYKYENVQSKPMVPIQRKQCLLYIDGLHEGDPDLQHAHHYLSTSGGYDTPQGESARHASLVALGGWSKESMAKALKALAVDLSVKEQDVTATVPGEEVEEEAGEGVDETDGEVDPDGSAETEGDRQRADGDFGAGNANEQGDEEEQGDDDELFDEVFYYTGGRIREVFEYLADPSTWKREKRSMIGRIKREDAMLSVVETKGSGSNYSPDRVRTMFRKADDPSFFGDCLQIVDSQFFAHLLQDRCGLEDYYNAYIHAKNTKLASAAGCHFEELVHQLFYKCPRPIKNCVQGVVSGSDGVGQLEAYREYWVPSIPNFANIDGALLLQGPNGKVTLWCFQYTVATKHKFNPRTFRSKFLRPVLRKFQLNADDVDVKILFIVPDDVATKFVLPQELCEEEWEGVVDFVDCSGVDALESFFERLPFIDSPVHFNRA